MELLRANPSGRPQRQQESMIQAPIVPVERIRGRKLQRLRAAHFAANPLCVRCKAKGIARAATEYDHIIALTNGGTNDEENMQGLCADCHEAKTNEDLGYTPKVVTGADGWPVEQTQGTATAARWRRAERGRK